MSQDTMHPLTQQWRGRLLVLQGWVLRDRQRVLQGRCDLLLGQISQLQRRVSASAPAELPVAHLTS